MRRRRRGNQQGDERGDARDTYDTHAGDNALGAVHQVVEDGLGCASYLIGDEQTGALVVDPAYAIDQYLETAERTEFGSRTSSETHNHADHVSGHGRSRSSSARPVAIHPAAEPSYPFEPLEDGAEVEVGQCSSSRIHTPGHRPEHCCFAVIDRSRGDRSRGSC